MNFTTVRGIDFAEADRKAFLAKANRSRVISVAKLDAATIASVVTKRDPRSVGASLVGRSDFRVWWWNVVQRFHGLVAPQENLEWAMYRFHRFHHALTVARLNFGATCHRLSLAFREDGYLAGIEGYVGKERH
jgi:hypothetical protein